MQRCPTHVCELGHEPRLSREPTGLASPASCTASARSVRSTVKSPSLLEGGSEAGNAAARPKQAARKMVGFMVKKVRENDCGDAMLIQR